MTPFEHTNDLVSRLGKKTALIVVNEIYYEFRNDEKLRAYWYIILENLNKYTFK